MSTDFHFYCRAKKLMSCFWKSYLVDTFLGPTLNFFDTSGYFFSFSGIFGPILTTDIGSCCNGKKYGFFPNFKEKIPKSHNKKITIL